MRGWLYCRPEWLKKTGSVASLGTLFCVGNSRAASQSKCEAKLFPVRHLLLLSSLRFDSSLAAAALLAAGIFRLSISAYYYFTHTDAARSGSTLMGRHSSRL